MATFGNLNLKGTEITLRKTELKSQSSVLGKLGDTYTEHAKLVFCFDVSGSMSSRVAKSYTSQYLWTPELMAKIRMRVEAAFAILNAGDDAGDDDALTQLSDGDPTFLSLTATDEELQERIVKANPIEELNVLPDFTQKHQTPPTRMEITKKLAKSEIEKRYAKYPSSKVAVIQFGEGAEISFDDGKPDDLWPVLDAMNEHGRLSGSTDIMGAIRAAVECCRKNPSPVGVHHVIIVSDGGAPCHELASWLPTLKASGVVLDYIHIGNEHGNAELKAACEALGGEFVVVNSEQDFAERFALAVARLMLPPAK